MLLARVNACELTEMKDRSRQILRVVLQIVSMVVILGALLWYVGVGSLYNSLKGIRVSFLCVSFLAYFGINLLFTVRLRRVLKREGIKTSFGRTLLAQYAGMLSSDVTPGRSGYVLTPIYLMDQDIPTSISLSGVLGIQSVEFLVKVLGGSLAVLFLVRTVDFSQEMFVIAALGIGLMLAGAVLLAALTWSETVIDLFNRVTQSRFLARLSGGLVGKLEQYRTNARKTRRAIPEIALITGMCWILKGFEWYFLGLALGITQIGWLGFFLLHPLVTALGFVPLTPSGIGFQEGAIVGVFILLGVAAPVAAAFALLSRVLLVVEDLAGVPQIAKSTSILVFSKQASDTPMTQ